MLNQIPEIAPAGVVVAVMGWAGLSYAVTGPEIGKRIAEADHVPACQVRLAEGITSRFDTAIAEAGTETQEERNARMANHAFNQLPPEHRKFMSIFGGGQIDAALEIQREAIAEARRRRAALRKQIKDQKAAFIAKAPDRCRCQAREAIASATSQWALYAGSFGLITGDGVSDFASRIGEHEAVCAARFKS